MKMLIFGFMMSIGWYLGKVFIDGIMNAFDGMIYSIKYKQKHKTRFRL